MGSDEFQQRAIRKPDLAKLEVLDNGKPLPEAECATLLAVSIFMRALPNSWTMAAKRRSIFPIRGFRQKY
jgi:acyl-CoA reductase-like NAD-dependent aldehyde dehydrogenase